VETISSIDQDYMLMIDHQIMRIRIRGEQLEVKPETEEIDAEGVFKVLAKGIWGFMGGQEKETPKPQPEED
jgi:hypothetical protein